MITLSTRRRGAPLATLDTGPAPGFMDGYESALEAQELVDNVVSSAVALDRAYNIRVEEIKKATGVEIVNPNIALTDWPERDEMKHWKPGESRRQSLERVFEHQRSMLAKQYPQHAEIIQAGSPIRQEADALAVAAEQRKNKVENDRRGGFFSSAGSIAGSAVGFLKDPVQLYTLALGPSVRGATVAGTVAKSALANAAVEAAIETARQPFVQSRRKRLGLDYGYDQAVDNVLLAAGIGGAFGGVFDGVGKAFSLKASKKAAARIDAGEALPGDLKEVADEAGLTLDSRATEEFDIAASERLDNAAAVSDAPNAPETALNRVLTEKTAMLDETGPPASGVIEVRKAADDEAAFADYATSGARRQLNDKPFIARTVNPQKIEVDAKTYQFKSDGDANGVTSRLNDVEQWDANAADPIMVHQLKNGQMVVADGHQRVGLAKRLLASGNEEKIDIDARVFKEADGWTAADMRARAAKRNMQQGSGTALDVARVLRDRPDLLDDSLPVNGVMMRKAMGLGRLDDGAFEQVVNGVVKEDYAALVGEMVADTNKHLPVLEDLNKFQPTSQQEARLLIGESLYAGSRTEFQNDMFGNFAVERSLLGERTSILNTAIKNLKANKKLFKALQNNADDIEAAGNMLDRAGNETRALTADTMSEIVVKLARVRGPISDALSDAALAVADEGLSVTKATQQFSKQVETMLQRDGLAKLANPPEPVLKPDTVIEPGSPEARAQGEVPEPSAAELEAAGQGNIFGDNARNQADMWDTIPDGVDSEGKARFTDSESLLTRAARDEEFADIVKSCKD